MMAMVTPHNKGMMIAFTFLEQTFFGWAQYLSIAFTQLGVHQHDLGMSGGLAGVARYAGGSLAQAIYVSILTNAQASRAASTVPQAAMQAGATSDTATALLAAFPLGSAAIAKVPGINDQILGAAGTAFQWSYAYGLKITALASLSFGFFGLIMCFLCEDIDPKVRTITLALHECNITDLLTDECQNQRFPRERCQCREERVPLIFTSSLAIDHTYVHIFGAEHTLNQSFSSYRCNEIRYTI